MLLRLLIITAFAAATAFSQIPPIEPGVSQELAKWRASQYSDISYKLNLTLEKMSPVLKGTIEIKVTVSESPSSAGGQKVALASPPPIILDWRRIPGHEGASEISNVTINGNAVEVTSLLAARFVTSVGGPVPLPSPGPEPYDKFLRQRASNSTGSIDCLERLDHLIFRDGARIGENVIKLDFTSPILTSGSAITRYVDKEDGVEYIYSLFVPSDASTAFPVFDQPDLKARFKLILITPDARPISNGKINWSENGRSFNKTEFAETKPISTYVFAFATGPFQNFDGAYVRKSQAKKFEPHAAEVRRLNREAIQYLETYFDYKFPFPKYEIVLIPEFPFGGMEHAGATFLREQSVIFAQEPTKNDIITRANLIFHEAAHQWFGDTVTMKWFDDLWLKEGFAEFMAYKTLEKVMPEANAWKVFYERNKRAAYATDSTKGTTPIYQPIKNLSAAKSAYGNIVYRKAPSFLRQAEFYLGEQKFQTAVRAFLKKHEFANAGWEDLVTEFEDALFRSRIETWSAWPQKSALEKAEFETNIRQKVRKFAESWVRTRGMPRVITETPRGVLRSRQENVLEEPAEWDMTIKYLVGGRDENVELNASVPGNITSSHFSYDKARFIFPNYQDYGYGIFLLDDKSRDYVLKNIQNEKDDFLRTMMWGSLWDSVREAELDPKDYLELVIKNITLEKDEGTIQTLLSRVTTSMNYYVSEPPALAGGQKRGQKATNWPPAHAGGSDLRSRLENLLIDKIQNASTQGQRITYYRAFLNIASTEKARGVLKGILRKGSEPPEVSAGSPAARRKNPPVTTGGSDSGAKLTLKSKDKFDIVTRLVILGDPDAAKLLAGLEKTETSDDAKRYAYAAHAAFATAENKAKFWTDFIDNKDISESWIEAAAGPFNAIEQSELTLPYLEKALAELPRLKRERKIFFVNDWLADFIGGHRDEKALGIVNKFLADNPTLDNDLRLKILENSDLLERAVKIRAKFPN